jgi:hypothetical protein
MLVFAVACCWSRWLLHLCVAQQCVRWFAGLLLHSHLPTEQLLLPFAQAQPYSYEKVVPALIPASYQHRT